MEKIFWKDRYDSGQIGFNQAEPSLTLRKYFPKLLLEKGEKVFVPLCGQSIDMVWLAKQGLQVVGVEFVKAAVENFINLNQLVGEWKKMGELEVFESTSYTLFMGDFFQLQAKHLEGIKAVYDRAAIIALPEMTRKLYGERLSNIVPNGCRIHLELLNYKTNQEFGPPFNVLQKEVEEYFGDLVMVNEEIEITERESFLGAGIKEIKLVTLQGEIKK